MCVRERYGRFCGGILGIFLEREMRQRERERDFSDLKIHPLHTSSANQSSFLFYLPFAYFSRQLSTPVLGQKLLRSCKILLFENPQPLQVSAFFEFGRNPISCSHNLAFPGKAGVRIMGFLHTRLEALSYQVGRKWKPYQSL